MSHLDEYYNEYKDMVIPSTGKHNGRRRIKLHLMQTQFQEQQKAKKRLAYKDGRKLVWLLQGKQLL